MCKRSYFLAGMPSSGKTTYLASLCRLVSQADTETLLHMNMSDVPEGIEFLENQIHNLLACKEVVRTPSKTQYKLQIPLVDEKGQKMELILPDQSGEIFRDLVRDRRILKHVADRLKAADVLLFFINTNTMVKQEYLSPQEKSAMKMLEEEGEPDLEQRHDPSDEVILERKKEKPDQSEVVDLLQGILFICKRKLQIKFIISAWDKVEKEYGKNLPLPEEYLKKELPLLHQYLISNTDRMEYQIWGVSAQGGDFGDEEDKIRMQEGDPEQFIKVVDASGKESQDLTRILYV